VTNGLPRGAGIGYYASYMGRNTNAKKGPSPAAKGEGSRAVVAAVAIGLVVVTMAAYWGVAGNGFVYYDDNNYVYENYYVRQGLTWQSVRWAFTAFDASNWHPLTWLSHMMDVQLFGLKAGWHHVTGLTFHIANVLLLFGLLRYMTGRLWASAFVAAVFALHPLHVESVAWVSERKDVLSTSFCFAALWAYGRYARQPGVGRYMLVLMLFVLGLLCKPMLVTLPALLLIVDYWPLERFGGRSPGSLVVEKLPFFAVSAASAVVTVMAQQSAIIELARASIPTRLTNAVISYCTYLWQTVWPVGLAAYYPHPQRPLYGPAAAGLAVLVAVTIFVLRQARQRRYLAAGWAWYLVSLVPVIGIVQVGDQGHADRYMYIPMVGVLIMVGWGLGDAVRSRPSLRIVAAAASAAAFVGMGVLTYAQVGCWKDDISLFGHAVRVVKGNYVMKMKLGDALLVEHRDSEALAELEESLKIHPMGHTYAAIGAVYQSRRDLTKAAECYQKALEMSPSMKSALVNMGGVMMDLGRYKESEDYLRKALAVDPYSVDAYSLLGRAQASAGKIDEAVVSLKKANQLAPDVPVVHFSLGVIYAMKHDFTVAIAEYERCLALSPKDAVAMSHLAACLAAAGRREEAVKEYEASIATDANVADVYCSLAVLLNDMGRRAEAIERVRQAMQIAPTRADIHELYMALSSGAK
jgi:protein O-mannosyl-transferase